jgi:hypothetical protein
VDIIAGPIGILLANALLGEITPKMAEAIAGSPAHKIVLPITTCNVEVVGKNEKDSLPDLIERLVLQVLAYKNA